MQAFWEKLLYGLSITGFGMVVVFVGLIILVVAIWIMSKLIDRGKNTDQAFITPAPKAVVTASLPQGENPKDMPEQVVAAITAALAVYCEDLQEKPRFIVRSIRPVDANSAQVWNQKGRQDQLLSFKFKMYLK